MKAWKRFSTHFYSFTNRIFSLLLAYKYFLLRPTGSPFISRFFSFTCHFFSFLLLHQSFVKKTASEICAEIRCAIKIVIRVKPPFPAIDGILISVQGSTSYSKLGLKSGYNHFESSLTSHSITMFQTEIRTKRYKALISGIYSPQEELQYAFRELFPGMKRV